MKKEVFLGLICLLLGVEPIFAQYNLAQPSRVIRVEDGLPNHYMRGLVQDSYGFIWIGSFDGLSRFDGKKVEVFRHVDSDSLSLTQNGVISMAADPNNGQVWIGTFSGLNLFQPETGRFRNYLHNDQDSTSLPSNYISWLYVDRQSTLWIGSRSNTLCRLDANQNSFFQYQPDSIASEEAEVIQSIAQDALNDSLIWLGTAQRLFSFNKYNNTFSDTPSRLSGIQEIEAHNNGYLYLRDATGQILVYAPQTRTLVTSITPKKGWNFGRLFQTSTKDILISCNNGLALLDTKDQSISYPWEYDPAQNKRYLVDLLDRNGRIWSTSTSGLEVYDPERSQFSNHTYDTTAASAPFITQRIIEDPKEEIIYLNVSAGDGLHYFDRKTKEWFHVSKPADYEGKWFYGVDMTQLDNGQLLLLDRYKIYTLSQDKKRMVEHPVTRNLPKNEKWRNLYLDSKGFIWLGGLENGVVKIDTRNWEVISLAEWLPSCNIPHYRWNFFEDSKENIWITTCDGIARYSYQEDAFHFLLHEDNAENTFKTPKDFQEDLEGLLWVSDELESMLGAINLEEPEKGIYQKFSFAQNSGTDSIQVVKGGGVAALGISKLALDSANNLWSISAEGIMKIRPDRKSVELYNQVDGLQWLDKELQLPTTNQIEALSTGEIIVGYRKGMSIFDPSKLRISRERPQPYLTAFNVYNNPWPSDSSLFLTRSIELDYWENYFSFEFASIGFTSPEHLQYQYKLEGVDEEWINSGQRSYAAYTNVDGGDYTFLVKVANQDGVWNEEPLKIELSVAIPWWETWWFKALMTFLIVGGVYTFYQYRVRQIRKAERLKSEFEHKLANFELTALRSQMNPHFIFNCMNSIESYIIKNETKKASEYLNDFSRLIRLILQNSRSNYVSLSDELEALALYMDMENLRLRQSFTYKIRLAEGLDANNTEIPPMLLQPYVENAIWHGLMHKEERGLITIELKTENNFLLCSIEDNGVGRKRSAELRSRKIKKTSMGMKITQERIDIINKAYSTDTSVRIIDLVSPEGEAMGTRVEVRIML